MKVGSEALTFIGEAGLISGELEADKSSRTVLFLGFLDNSSNSFSDKVYDVIELEGLDPKAGSFKMEHYTLELVGQIIEDQFVLLDQSIEGVNTNSANKVDSIHRFFYPQIAILDDGRVFYNKSLVSSADEEGEVPYATLRDFLEGFPARRLPGELVRKHVRLHGHEIG